MQALEAYHRRTTSNEELTKCQHEVRITKILGTVPSEYRDWLQNKLIFSNEPSLRRRLSNLYDIFSLTLKSLNINKKSLIHKVVTTRNDLTHYDVKPKKNSPKRKELFVISQKLRIIVEMCLMKEIGFNMEEINNLVCKHYKDRLKLYEY